MSELNQNNVPFAPCCGGMSGKRLLALAVCVAGGFFAFRAIAADGKKVPDQVSGGKYTIHDMSRPKPPVVTPGTFSTQEQPGTPPSDAVVLFDGKDLSKWKSGNADASWKVENGYFQVDGKGGIETREQFGDVQLHVEWQAPNPPKGTSQGRGNSGIYIMGKYEVQVLDTFENDTYADGGATAIYGQHPPLANACRKPGEWQVYDIIFRGPRFDAEGKLTRPTTITVFHNGVLTQDHFQLTGPTGHYSQPPYKAHPETGTISLQNHGDPVKYRNIWLRKLPPVDARGAKIEEAAEKPAADAK